MVDIGFPSPERVRARCALAPAANSDGSARWDVAVRPRHPGWFGDARPLPWDPEGDPVNFDDDVKVRYPPDLGYPASVPAFRVATVAPGHRRLNDSSEEKSAVVEAVKVNPESRMLVDGKLVDADTGRTFDNVNPATEEVIGQVA